MIKEILKKSFIYDPLVFCKNMMYGFFYEFSAKYFPIVNARAEMIRQKQNQLIRPVNLKYPQYFNEKMLWLKYYLYNKSKIVAQCYNKYLVREYVTQKGLSHILNQLFFTSPSIEDIPWENLPEECVIKLSNGYYGHVFKRKEQNFNIDTAKKTLEKTKVRCKYAFRVSGDLFAYGTTPVFICERFIHPSNGKKLPDDYKFHCFNGEPKFLEYISNRDYANKDEFFKSNFIDIDKMIDRYDLEGEASPTDDIFLPRSFTEMVSYARILSEDFPYVRVDFYEENDKPIFGELTFTPYHKQTKSSLSELGEMLSLSEIDKYKQILLN